MGSEIPSLSRQAFDEQLLACSALPLNRATLEALFVHFNELRRWNRRLSLVGPGTAADVVQRHYGESLAALPLLDAPGRVLLDVGSGAGFPGLVLAIVRRDLEVVLLEPRGRKCAFLSSVAARLALSCSCLGARVETGLPQGLPETIDWITTRAVKLSSRQLGALASRLSPKGALLLWRGAEVPPLPPGWDAARELPLEGSRDRRLIEVRRCEPSGLR